MGAVDVQRAFHTMTVPPPHPHDEEGWPHRPVEDDQVEAPVAASGECPQMEPGCDELEGQARETVIRLRPILRIRPQPLDLVLEFLEVELDLSHGCAERLFWLAQERGYVSLREGRVYVGEAPTSGPLASSMVEAALGTH